MLLKNLRISPYRKLLNLAAKVFGRYTDADYRDVFEEYQRDQAQRTVPLHPLPVDM